MPLTCYKSFPSFFFLFESNRILTDQVQNLIDTQEQLAIEKKEEEKVVVDKISEKKGFFSRFLKK